MKAVASSILSQQPYHLCVSQDEVAVTYSHSITCTKDRAAGNRRIRAYRFSVIEKHAGLERADDQRVFNLQSSAAEAYRRVDARPVNPLFNQTVSDCDNSFRAHSLDIVDLAATEQIEGCFLLELIFQACGFSDVFYFSTAHHDGTWQQSACVLIPDGGCSQRNTAYHTDHLPMAPCAPAFFTFDHTECPPLKRKDSLRPAGYFYKSKWRSFCAANSQLNVVQFLQRYPHCCFSEKSIGTINSEKRRFEAYPARSESMPAS
ncbi:hypothetical protein [Pseudomonas sp. LS-2]|uniref:hypothetical protein n=1 Tax=Pseudomonas sp. LS-2 TaxID=2315859 RepID=UPI0021140B21|nr:hypothetical protein [Pseudomonas sp. LS-2]